MVVLGATVVRLATTLEERFKEAERKVQRAQALAGEAIGGGGHAEGISRLKTRLVKLTAAGRKLASQAGAAGGGGAGGGAAPAPLTQALVAQLEAQERHVAAWFADLQWQLEGLFSSQKSRMTPVGGPLGRSNLGPTTTPRGASRESSSRGARSGAGSAHWK